MKTPLQHFDNYAACWEARWPEHPMKAIARLIEPPACASQPIKGEFPSGTQLRANYGRAVVEHEGDAAEGR